MKTIDAQLKIRTGNQMIAEGALAAGCQFFAGYPITPASGIYKTMIEELPKRNGVAISAPDEISALAYCVGASGRGVKAMTATSGPGWALMIETVQYALMTELPVVIALVQRLGPSTGGATQGGQGDVLLAEFSTSGGYTLPVFSASTPQECYEATTAAFHWAERLRTPVIVLSDKEVGMMSEDVDYHATKGFPPVERPQFKGKKEEYKTYDFTDRADVPLFSPVGGDQKVTMTGSAHDKRGTLQKNSPETVEVLLHLQEKISARRDDIALLRIEGDASHADVLVVSFGITARTAREALHQAQKRGKKVALVNVLSLFPIPEKALKEAARHAQTIVVAEENITGQYRSVLQSVFTGKQMVGVNAMGRMIAPEEILREIETASTVGTKDLL